MGGGLMQLVAYGAQDFYLTGNPQITFFKVVYRRHTNFATESIEQTFNGSSAWGSRAVCNLQRSGDLVTKMYLRLSLPRYDSGDEDQQWAWVSRVGHFMLADVIMEIGGTQIDKLYGDWLNVWYELARNFAHDRGYGEMIGDTAALTTLSQSHEATTLYIPLQFACCRNDGLALPVIALQYHDIKITVDFSPFEQMINYTSKVVGGVGLNAMKAALPITNCSLFVDYVYLDNEERKRFAQASHEYLFEQLQFTGSETVSQQSSKTRLNLNHPCKELVWNASSGKFFGNAFLAYDPTNMELARVNATKRFVLRCAQYASATAFSTSTVGNLVPVVSGLGTANTAIFGAINAIYLNATQLDIDNITILGRLLTVEEFSTPVTTLVPASELLNASSVTSRSAVTSDGHPNNDVVVYQWDNYGCYLDGSRNPSARVLLQLNGHDRFSQREGAYFNYVQPYQCHTNTPADGINCYSFSLNPEQHQPSGTCNFSRIDNASLNVTYDDAFYFQDGNSQFNVYALNYNVLRVMSGMGGLAYSN